MSEHNTIKIPDDLLESQIRDLRNEASRLRAERYRLEFQIREAQAILQDQDSNRVGRALSALRRGVPAPEGIPEAKFTQVIKGTCSSQYDDRLAPNIDNEMRRQVARFASVYVQKHKGTFENVFTLEVVLP